MTDRATAVMTDTDHFATAALSDSFAMEKRGRWSRKWHRKAQVHATLALAEQQRIANVIALAAALPALDEWTDGPETAAREAAYSLIEYTQIDPDDEMLVIHPDIARTLRIETP